MTCINVMPKSPEWTRLKRAFALLQTIEELYTPLLELNNNIESYYIASQNPYFPWKQKKTLNGFKDSMIEMVHQCCDAVKEELDKCNGLVADMDIAFDVCLKDAEKTCMEIVENFDPNVKQESK